MTDHDIEEIVDALKKTAAIVEKKDIAALTALYEGLLQDAPDALAQQKKAVAELSAKDAEALWRAGHALFSSIDFSTLPNTIECKFYEKTEGKNYDRATICKIPLTIKKELIDTISPSTAAAPAANTDLALVTKAALSKIHGIWYAPLDDMVGRFMSALITTVATTAMQGIKTSFDK